MPKMRIQTTARPGGFCNCANYDAVTKNYGPHCFGFLRDDVCQRLPVCGTVCRPNFRVFLLSRRSRLGRFSYPVEFYENSVFPTPKKA